MYLDPVLPIIVKFVLVILLFGFACRLLKQPYLLGYLVAGVVLGPYGWGVISDEELLSRLGSIGVVLLLFFLGMELSPQNLIKNWRVIIVGTLLQILASVFCVWLIGYWIDWPFRRIVLLGFVISMSSTTVILKLLQNWQEVDTKIGQEVLGISLMQDMAVIPMLIVLSFLGSEGVSYSTVVSQVIGGVLVTGVAVWLSLQKEIHLRWLDFFKKDREMQVIVALSICLVLSLVTATFNLSVSLGAFIGGMLVRTIRETSWVSASLEPFQVVFVAVFFVSLGMLIDLEFIRLHWLQILLLLLAVFLTNTFINAAILFFLGDSWRSSLYAGALLAPIGEFSFILATIGKQTKIVSDYTYQMTIAIISLSLLASLLWIYFIKANFLNTEELCLERDYQQDKNRNTREA